MKNFLAPVLKNEVVAKVTGGIGKFYLAHETAILTGGTIGFSMATTAVTLKNAGQINDIIADTKDMLEQCNDNNERSEVYIWAARELAPLVAPILIFQLATIGCAIKSKKNSDLKDKKLAEAASALSLAQAAIAQYQSFQKDTEEALGEKKYAKLQDDIYKNQQVDGRQFSQLPLEGAPCEILMIDKYSGRPFWGTTDRIENAAKELSRMVAADGGYDEVTINTFYDLIGNNNLTPTGLGDKFGYISGDDVSAHFADTRYVFPNGTMIPAFEVYLYPEPGYVDLER